MSQKKISYLNRTFEDYQSALKDFTKTYYPELAEDMDDASIGSWLIDMFAAVGDNLSYYIDRAYNETNIESAMLKKSVYALARNNGFKIPGPKGSMVELEFTCKLPTSTSGVQNSPSMLDMPSWVYAPVIKKGTLVSSTNGQYFEVMEDVDFTENFNFNGEANRTWKPLVDTNQKVKEYLVTKTAIASAGVTRVMKIVLDESNVKPFMEVLIPEKGVMNVESIVIKDGVNYQSDPCEEEFSLNTEMLVSGDGTVEMYRFFETESLSDQYRWTDDLNYSTNGGYITTSPIVYTYSAKTDNGYIVETNSIAKGKWSPLTQKFITEYTDNGYLKVIFGGGKQVGQDVDYRDAVYSTQYQISNMINNNFLGRIPKTGSTMFIQYRIGGGSASNVAKGTIKNIVSLNAYNKKAPATQTDANVAASIISSIRVNNTIPSVSGKDMPTVEELRYLIKYHNAAQNRCITVKDYQDRINKLPPRYGTPFRVGTIEENNKLMIYLLMTDTYRKLTDSVPSVLIENISNYLSMYRSLNDYVEIKPGRIINLSFDIDVYIDKNYNSQNVIYNIIESVRNYMDINRHLLGEDIFVGDIQRMISNIDGVLNLYGFRVYNEFNEDEGYSPTRISQPTVYDTNSPSADVPIDETNAEIDLEASDFILNSEVDEMFEIKYPERDIRVVAKAR